MTEKEEIEKEISKVIDDFTTRKLNDWFMKIATGKTVLYAINDRKFKISAQPIDAFPPDETAIYFEYGRDK